MLGSTWKEAAVLLNLMNRGCMKSWSLLVCGIVAAEGRGSKSESTRHVQCLSQGGFDLSSHWTLSSPSATDTFSIIQGYSEVWKHKWPLPAGRGAALRRSLRVSQQHSLLAQRLGRAIDLFVDGCFCVVTGLRPQTPRFPHQRRDALQKLPARSGVHRRREAAQ